MDIVHVRQRPAGKGLMAMAHLALQANGKVVDWFVSDAHYGQGK